MINKAIILGRLGRDPEMRSTTAGKSITNLSVATTETWKDKNSGEKKEKTEWHRVAIFAEGLAQAIKKYAAKGDLIYVEGKLVTRKWTDKAGVEKYSTEINVDLGGVVKMLGSRGSNEGGGDRSADTSTESDNDADNGVYDDEIPF
jgi:single-strand DNA-binding protein